MEKEFDNSRCWFCSKLILNSPKNLIIRMHKVLERKGNKVTYLPLNVLVPRCRKCSSIHLLNNIVIYTLAAISSIGLMISPLGQKIFSVIDSWHARVLPGLLFIIIIVALAIPGILAGIGIIELVRSSTHIKDNDYRKSYPAYKLAIEQGYKEGKKPG